MRANWDDNPFKVVCVCVCVRACVRVRVCVCVCACVCLMTVNVCLCKRDGEGVLRCVCLFLNAGKTSAIWLGNKKKLSN